MADGGLLSLSWNNHKATFCHILSNLRERERYTDVTLACEGKFYPVHKLVLSTCSEYFESMFEHTPCKHPIVVLKDLKCDEVESLLSYMYAGVVNVAQNDLARLIKAAELLKVKGLAVPDEPPHDMDHHKRVSPVRNNSRDEAAFPPPKRRRRESDGTRDDHHRGTNKSPVPSPANSPYHAVDYHQDGSSRTSNSEEHRTERSIDRIEQDMKGDVKGGGDVNADHQHHRHSPSRPSSPLQVVIEETLVKEEVIEPVSDDKEDLMNSGMDYGSISSDGRIDNPASDPTSQDHQMLSSKYDQSLGSSSQPPPPPHHLSDSVMEALAGPSGMQGWLAGGGDLSAGFPGVEGYGGDGRHLASQQGQGHPLVLMYYSCAGEESKIGAESSGEEDTKEFIQKCIIDQTQEYEGHLTQNYVEPTTRNDTQDPDIKNTLNPIHEPTKHSVQNSTQDSGQLNATQHNQGASKSYQCPVCVYKSDDFKGFRAHIGTHKNWNTHICPYCFCVMEYSRDLKSHMQTHTKGKPHACPHCPFRCSRNSYLKIHLRLHTGEKPNKCPHCSYQSFITQHFKRHLKTHDKLKYNT